MRRGGGGGWIVLFSKVTLCEDGVNNFVAHCSVIQLKKSSSLDHSVNFKQSFFLLLGPVPPKMVKFNPGLSQISSKVVSSKSMQLAVTKYC